MPPYLGSGVLYEGGLSEVNGMSPAKKADEGLFAMKRQRTDDGERVRYYGSGRAIENFDEEAGEVDYEALEEIQMEMCEGEAFSAATLCKIGSLDTSTLRALFPIPESLVLRNPEREAREVMSYDSAAPIGQIPATAFLGSLSAVVGGEEGRVEDEKKEEEELIQHPDALSGAL